MALVFFDDAFAPVRCADEVATALRRLSDLQVRIGLHSGLVHCVTDINGKENVVGEAINTAQRVMDCGDAGHILVSGTQAQFLSSFGEWKESLSDIGVAQVKHGAVVHLFNFARDGVGNPAVPAKLTAATKGQGSEPAMGLPAETAPPPRREQTIALIYRRGAEADECLLGYLERALQVDGHHIFIDRRLRVGLDWASTIEQTIRTADAVIPLLSPSSVESEMLAFEIQIADEEAQRNQGRPRLLPVRVNWEGALPPQLATLLDRYQYALWRGPEDHEIVAGELLEALRRPNDPHIGRNRNLEAPGGAVPLTSRLYLERPTDGYFRASLRERDSIVLVEGARQMGKTSLLSRGLQQARKEGARVAFTDFQKLNTADLHSLETFYKTLGSALADQLDLDKYPEEVWRPQRSPNQNFERYIRTQVFGNGAGYLVWGMDEVDRLFTCDFAGEVFGLFRSWHNGRATDPAGPWSNLTQAIAYATEAHLFITDLNQSPFNVGTRLRLRDFTLEETAELNRRHLAPLKDAAETELFHRLLGGQPYLVRRGLHELTARSMSLEELVRTAPSDEGPFSDHLRRFLVLLSRDQELLETLRELLKSRRTPDPKLFYRLRAAGLLRGEQAAGAQFRCQMYELYLQRRLL